MAVNVVSKLVRDLVVGDIVVKIDGQAISAVLHYNADNMLTLHHTEVVALEEGWENAPVFDPILQDQDPPNASLRALADNPISRAERIRWQMEQANAQPNAGKKFPVVKVSLGGFENGERLDQAPIEFTLRVFETVDVLTGTIPELEQIKTKEIPESTS